MSVAEAFGDFSEVLAAMAPAKVIELRAPASMSERVEELVNKKKDDQLSEEEAVEMGRYLSLELMAAGMSTEEILEDYPYIEKQDIDACLLYRAFTVKS